MLQYYYYYYYIKITGEIYIFIGKQGAGYISHYMEVKFSGHSPTEYLLNSQMDSDKIWTTVGELVDVSMMLDVEKTTAKQNS